MKNSCVLLPQKPVTFKNLFCRKAATARLSPKFVYRKDGTTREKLIITDDMTGNVVKIINYSFFDDKKVSSVEEYEDGIKIKETCYSLFKIVADFDKISGKKIKVSNYDLKSESKIISVYDYDINTEKITRMTVYHPNGKTVAFIKEFSPKTGVLTRCINYKKDTGAIYSVSQYKTVGDTCIKTTYYYKTPLYMLSDTELDKKIIADNLNNRVLSEDIPRNVASLIDNLYSKNKHRQVLKIS